MTTYIFNDDVPRAILSRLGLEGEPVERIIIFLSAPPSASPWDHVQYDPDAIVIRVWDPEDKIAICTAIGMDATNITVLLLDFQRSSLARYVAHGLVRAERESLAKTLGGISGSPLTHTYLPAGHLSRVGVNVPGEVIEGNRHLAHRGPPILPYADLDEEPDNS